MCIRDSDEDDSDSDQSGDIPQWFIDWFYVLFVSQRAVWQMISIALLSPSLGPFAKEFSDLGVAVHIGQIGQLLARVRDVRLHRRPADQRRTARRVD